MCVNWSKPIILKNTLYFFTLYAFLEYLEDTASVKVWITKVIKPKKILLSIDKPFVIKLYKYIVTIIPPEYITVWENSAFQESDLFSAIHFVWQKKSKNQCANTKTKRDSKVIVNMTLRLKAAWILNMKKMFRHVEAARAKII